MSERQRDQFLTVIADAYAGGEHDTRLRLALGLLAATLDGDSGTVNRILEGADRDDLHWLAGALANLTALNMADHYGQPESRDIVAGHLADLDASAEHRGANDGRR